MKVVLKTTMMRMTVRLTADQVASNERPTEEPRVLFAWKPGWTAWFWMLLGYPVVLWTYDIVRAQPPGNGRPQIPPPSEPVQ
jgi:hypothetical protein